MSFLEDLMTPDQGILPLAIPNYTYQTIPLGAVPCYGKLRCGLNKPGDRHNRELILELVDAQPAGLEVYATQVGLPFVVPTTDRCTGLPVSVRPIDLNPFAEMETILYDYIESWQYRGDPKVLEDLFVFRLPSAPSPFQLWKGLEFSPSARTMRQLESQFDIHFRSRMEKVVLSYEFNLYVTFHLTYEVNILREPMAFALRYWLHDRYNHISADNEEKRNPMDGLSSSGLTGAAP